MRLFYGFRSQISSLLLSGRGQKLVWLQNEGLSTTKGSSSNRPRESDMRTMPSQFVVDIQSKALDITISCGDEFGIFVRIVLRARCARLRRLLL